MLFFFMEQNDDMMMFSLVCLLSVQRICIRVGRMELWTLGLTVWTVETRGGQEMRQVLFRSLKIPIYPTIIFHYVLLILFYFLIKSVMPFPHLSLLKAFRRVVRLAFESGRNHQRAKTETRSRKRT